MNVYKVIVKNDFSNPILFVVDSIAEIEELYNKHYPDGSAIMIIELLGNNVINGWGEPILENIK